MSAVTLLKGASFLATGRLGPVHCGLSRNKIAAMLGPPDMWIGATIDSEVVHEGAEWPAGTEPEFPPIESTASSSSASIPSGRMR